MFEERHVYRIDHYLGKEPVQDIMALRFANVIFEPIWNRRYVDSVQITAAETIGVESRGGYYEGAGALRDMIQNHVLNLLALVAMEPPISSAADSIRDEKCKVLSAVRPIEPGRVAAMTARGQYGPGSIDGKQVIGYRQEPSVDPNSNTETYAAVKLWIDNWRWADVPFYVRSGKRLAHKLSEIVVRFRQIPHRLFGELGDSIEQNTLVLKIQPDEGVQIRFNAKVPGPRMHIRAVTMDFNYGTGFGVVSPPAYERLIGDAMRGDAMLFTRWDAVETAWEIVTPVLETWLDRAPSDFPNYEAGSQGPRSATNYCGSRPRGSGGRTLWSAARWFARARHRRSLDHRSSCAVRVRPRSEQEHALPSVATLNLVALLDDLQYRPWVLERAAKMAEKHPSRLLILDGTRSDDTVEVTTSASRGGGMTVLSQRVDLAIGDADPRNVATLVHDISIAGAHTVLWWSSADMSCELLEALVPIVDSIAIDSSGAQRGVEALRAAVTFVAKHPSATLCDLAYMRLAPWREMIAQFFDDPALYHDLFSLRRLEVAAGSDAETLYLAGWLGSRLSWRVRDRETFVAHDGTAIPFVRTKEGERRRVARVVLASEDSTNTAALSDDNTVVCLHRSAGAKAKPPCRTRRCRASTTCRFWSERRSTAAIRIFDTTLETVQALL